MHFRLSGQTSKQTGLFFALFSTDAFPLVFIHTQLVCLFISKPSRYSKNIGDTLVHRQGYKRQAEIIFPTLKPCSRVVICHFWLLNHHHSLSLLVPSLFTFVFLSVVRSFAGFIKHPTVLTIFFCFYICLKQQTFRVWCTSYTCTQVDLHVISRDKN